MSDELKKAVEEAERELDLALPHIEKARKTLADALGVDPEERPSTNVNSTTEEWNATRLMQNIWSAHLHCDDRYGS